MSSPKLWAPDAKRVRGRAWICVLLAFVEPLTKLLLRHGGVDYVMRCSSGLPRPLQAYIILTFFVIVPFALVLAPICALPFVPSLVWGVFGLCRFSTEPAGLTIVHRGRKTWIRWEDLSSLVFCRFMGAGRLKSAEGRRIDFILVGYDRDEAAEIVRLICTAAELDYPCSGRSLPLLLRCRRRGAASPSGAG
jgi:hypothetical protein